ncbi:MAG: hypothetical protein ACPHXR_03865 [Flavicella sp.]
MKVLKNLLILATVFLLAACGDSSEPYTKSPLDIIITKNMSVENYSVILADMDYRDDNDAYYHKYRIIKQKPGAYNTEGEDEFDVELTDWQQVSDITFEQYKNDLGMTILSKKDGVLNKKSSPAGYSDYVGNKKYGSWQTNSNGSSFWVFYGQYSFMRSLFGMGSGMYYRNDYDYYRRNYYGSRNFYGRTNRYGTSTYNNRNSTWSTKPKTFKDRVRSKVSRSAATSSSRKYSSSSSYGSSKTTRSFNRFSNSSSSRSRSGGFGK